MRERITGLKRAADPSVALDEKRVERPQPQPAKELETASVADDSDIDLVEDSDDCPNTIEELVPDDSNPTVQPEIDRSYALLRSLWCSGGTSFDTVSVKNRDSLHLIPITTDHYNRPLVYCWRVQVLDRTALLLWAQQKLTTSNTDDHGTINAYRRFVRQITTRPTLVYFGLSVDINQRYDPTHAALIHGMSVVHVDMTKYCLVNPDLARFEFGVLAVGEHSIIRDDMTRTALRLEGELGMLLGITKQAMDNDEVLSARALGAGCGKWQPITNDRSALLELAKWWYSGNCDFSMLAAELQKRLACDEHVTRGMTRGFVLQHIRPLRPEVATVHSVSNRSHATFKRLGFTMDDNKDIQTIIRLVRLGYTPVEDKATRSAGKQNPRSLRALLRTEFQLSEQQAVNEAVRFRIILRSSHIQAKSQRGTFIRNEVKRICEAECLAVPFCDDDEEESIWQATADRIIRLVEAGYKPVDDNGVWLTKRNEQTNLRGLLRTRENIVGKKEVIQEAAFLLAILRTGDKATKTPRGQYIRKEVEKCCQERGLRLPFIRNS